MWLFSNKGEDYMGKIDDILKPGKKINVADYDYSELYGMEAIIEFAANKERVGYVTATGELFPRKSYGRRYEGAEEALLFTDGSVLLCGTVSCWGGTFASHDDIFVNYYALTPKLPKPIKKSTRRRG